MDPRNEAALLQKQLISIITKCKENDQTVDEARDLIEYKGVDARAYAYSLSLYYKSKNYFSPLHYAARNGSVRILELLLKNGVDPNVQDRFQVTPLHVASENGHKICVTRLLDAGADQNAKTRSFTNPHSWYLSFDPGPGAHKPYKEGTSPLHLAVVNRHLDCVRALMWYGADCNGVNSLGETALYLAAREGFTDCIMTLLSNSVSLTILSVPTNRDDTPLHACLRYTDVEGMEDCVKALVDRGSEVSCRNKCLDSPITIAMKNGWKREIIEYMVLKGYKLNLDPEPGLPRYQGKDPLDLAINGGYRTRSAERCGRELACFFIQMGANTDLLDILASELRQPAKASPLQEKIMESLPYLPDLQDLLSRRIPYYERFLESDDYLSYRHPSHACQGGIDEEEDDNGDDGEDSDDETHVSLSRRRIDLLRHDRNTRRRYLSTLQEMLTHRSGFRLDQQGIQEVIHSFPWQDGGPSSVDVSPPATLACTPECSGSRKSNRVCGISPGFTDPSFADSESVHLGAVTFPPLNSLAMPVGRSRVSDPGCTPSSRTSNPASGGVASASSTSSDVASITVPAVPGCIQFPSQVMKTSSSSLTTACTDGVPACSGGDVVSVSCRLPRRDADMSMCYVLGPFSDSFGDFSTSNNDSEGVDFIPSHDPVLSSFAAAHVGGTGVTDGGGDNEDTIFTGDVGSEFAQQVLGVCDSLSDTDDDSSSQDAGFGGRSSRGADVFSSSHYAHYAQTVNPPRSVGRSKRDSDASTNIGKKHADYKKRCEELPSLQHLARCAIRAAMGRRLPKVGELPVPNNVKNYILLGYKLFSTSNGILAAFTVPESLALS